jgi:NADH-quinone oxidoreductase subunit N
MPASLQVMLGVCGLFNLLFFVYPGPLIRHAGIAAQSLF